ncbi:MAG: SUMF1/EgtB/PvdO family nonheme iron enzyme [Deltaproteobacteria bacterium]|nr:SUMF1/EgtB/PvdO family nonheme iron enzyme [Deltaproteobacteria bacterium]
MRDPYGIVGKTIDRRYAIARFVAEGGYGVVYQAEAVALGVKVAIKVLRSEIVASSPEARARFDQEARVLAKLRHPGIVAITDASHLDDGTPYLALEWIDGETLDRYLERVGPLPLDDALRMLGPVARAIAYAHEHAIIHRDLKPSNVMIDVAGEAKVLDFGLARWASPHGVKTTTQSGAGLSIGFAAPEQYGKEFGPVDERADQFALAAVLWASLTAKPPFAGETLTEVMWATCMKPVRPSLSADRPDLPTALDAVLQRALSIRAEARFSSIREMWSALEESARHGDADPSRAPTTARVASPPTRTAGPLPDVATLPSPDLSAGAPRTKVSGSLAVAPTMPAPMTGPAGTAPTGAAPAGAEPPPPTSTPPSAAPSTRASPATRWGIFVALGAAIAAGVFAAWPIIAPAPVKPVPSAKPNGTSKAPPAASSAPLHGLCGVLGETEACIAGGRFERGPFDCSVNDPPHRAACPAASVDVATFVIDRFEVSAAQWAACVKAKRCREILEMGAPEPKFPIRNVTQADGEAYCAWQKKRLPTDDEWELAAAGRHRREYPWGNDAPKPQHGVFTVAEPLTGPAEVTAPVGLTPEGVAHLAGNVAEWTRAPAPKDAPWPEGVAETDTPRFWVRGGGYDATAERLHAWSREAYPRDHVSPSIGFRCARSPK